MAKQRGRPRQYQREAALDAAIGVFWRRGYSATSLDDLATAMKMNRPSIYHAFGDKESIYQHALAQFIGRLRAEVGRRVSAEPDLKQALHNFYQAALDVYFSHAPASGCFAFCTATVEAIEHPRIRTLMKSLLEEIDALLTSRFRTAQVPTRRARHLDARSAANIAQAVLHSLAIRARVGESRASLDRMARAAVDVLVPAD